MRTPYAEVIGDPIGQTKSPAIHNGWLAALGLAGEFRALRVAPGALEPYLAARRADPMWRGCSVTIPHKEKVIEHLHRLDPGANAIGAVNCIVPGREGLIGYNTDIDGLASALKGASLAGGKVVIIGAGGAARAALRYLSEQRTGLVTILVRDVRKAARFARPGAVELRHLDDCEDAVAGACVLINASPLGMNGAPPMQQDLLARINAHARRKTFFDMVYDPLETPFLAAGRATGGRGVDGLTMLVGQARAAFQHFSGHPAPSDEADLRALLATARGLPPPSPNEGR